jgi:hypothetical protein
VKKPVSRFAFQISMQRYTKDAAADAKQLVIRASEAGVI